jgi:hypothetical protein
MIQLKLRIGDDPVEHDYAGETIALGRSSTCAIVLADRKVSRLHATIERTEDEVRLIDRNSSNGTRLNGREIESHPLMAGDTIGIGPSHLTVIRIAVTDGVGVGAKIPAAVCDGGTTVVSPERSPARPPRLEGRRPLWKTRSRVPLHGGT